MSNPLKEHTGSAFLITILMLLLLTLLGTFAFSRGMSEMVIARSHSEEVSVTYLAESGIQQVLHWLNHPEQFTLNNHFLDGYSGLPEEFFRPRLWDDNENPVFLNNSGGQFKGTDDSPDLLLNSPDDDLLLNHPVSGLFGPISALGKIKAIKVYRPDTPGGFCRIESTAEGKSGIVKSIVIEVASSPLKPFLAPVQSGDSSPGAKVPVKVHWGEVWTMGKAGLGMNIDIIPFKNDGIIPNGTPYGPALKQDPWFQIKTGKDILSPLPKDCDLCQQPYSSVGRDNIFQNQIIYDSYFSLDQWDYEEAKAFAKRYGRYFSTDPAGNLYKDGIPDTQHLTSPAEIFSSKSPGDPGGFVFIDTIDQKPPVSDNISTIHVPIQYAEGIYFINAHVNLKPSGPGISINVLSPPNEEFGKRFPIQLSNIQFNGVLYANGAISTSGPLNTFGSLFAKKGFFNSDDFEIWFNHRHALGKFQHLPSVTPVPGTWREIY